MKVGTDGVLLGAWCSLESLPKTILDIGTGTGIISLMLAQRSSAITIDGLEVDPSAYMQTVDNFENSDWSDRLYCYNTSFQKFVDDTNKETYDLIVSNPPFYTEDYITKNSSRNKARFTSSLTFKELIGGISKILSKSGFFSTIIPFKEESTFICLAEQHSLHLNKICRVQGNNNSDIKRSLMTFSFNKVKISETNLIIENSRHKYTKEYEELTNNFYLKM
ncbi:methyltransferase [Flavobacteriaceae bacterium]|jgi:tRNA1Val (adenine37-N6)-methyltransferase|nr:methyltransferase [Flavobacteriaceae bacterium]MDA9573171.1 methyltransferase [Flavobacteriaceae bacterium]MDA9631952.1 methyltransferase [Bacteroidota bacterium]MDC1320800.1 methyltransferase [Flavobacteriaceae bacterium]